MKRKSIIAVLTGLFMIAGANYTTAQSNVKKDIPVITNYKLMPLSQEQQELFAAAIKTQSLQLSKSKIQRHPAKVEQLKRK